MERPAVSQFAYPAIALAAIALCTAFIYRGEHLNLEPHEVTLPADGAEHTAFRIRLPKSWLGGTVTEEMPQPRLRLMQAGNIIDGLLQAPVTPGHLLLHLRWRYRSIRIPVTFVFDPSDSYGDGTPDFLRLHTAQDRAAFRAWFTALAEPPPTRPPSACRTRSTTAPPCCAGAIAMRCMRTTKPGRRPCRWRPAAALVRQYAYPLTPSGRQPVPRALRGLAAADAANGSFAQFADARTLWQRNTFFVARDLRPARPGDLLFYRQLEQDSPYDEPDATHYHSPFHSMISAGPRIGSSTTPARSAMAQAKMRRVALERPAAPPGCSLAADSGKQQLSRGVSLEHSSRGRSMSISRVLAPARLLLLPAACRCGQHKAVSFNLSTSAPSLPASSRRSICIPTTSTRWSSASIGSTIP